MFATCSVPRYAIRRGQPFWTCPGLFWPNYCYPLAHLSRTPSFFLYRKQYRYYSQCICHALTPSMFYTANSNALTPSMFYTANSIKRACYHDGEACVSLIGRPFFWLVRGGVFRPITPLAVYFHYFHVLCLQNGTAVLRRVDKGNLLIIPLECHYCFHNSIFDALNMTHWFACFFWSGFALLKYQHQFLGARNRAPVP